MASPKLSWAAAARKCTAAPQDAPTNIVHGIATLDPSSQVLLTPSRPVLKPRIAFISGHIDITLKQFSDNYHAALDVAIHRGDTFVLSTSQGADTLALAYLRSQNTDPSRITVYILAPYMQSSRSGHFNATQSQTNGTKLGDEALELYKKEGYNVKVVKGRHDDRDAAMTEDSDYDILWIRNHAETAALYGRKYRRGRVSGTQKNKDRRELKEKISTP